MDRLEVSQYLKDKPEIFLKSLEKKLQSSDEYSSVTNGAVFSFNWLDFSFIIKYQIVSPHKCILFKTYEIVDSEKELDAKEKKHVEELDFTIKISEQAGEIYLTALMNINPEDKLRQDTDRLVISFIKKYMDELEKTITKNYE